jgi:hypothetical protein
MGECGRMAGRGREIMSATVKQKKVNLGNEARESSLQRKVKMANKIYVTMYGTSCNPHFCNPL